MIFVGIGLQTKLPFRATKLERRAMKKSASPIRSKHTVLRQMCELIPAHLAPKNAIQWQLWTALLTYVLLRFLAVLSSWHHSLTRIFTVLRAVLWSRLDLIELLHLPCCI